MFFNYLHSVKIVSSYCFQILMLFFVYLLSLLLLCRSHSIDKKDPVHEDKQ